MNKNLFLLPLLGMFLLSLTSCQLAQEESAAKGDTLIGGIVTASTEEESLQNALSEGAEAPDRVYATEEAVSALEQGEEKGYMFPGLEGVFFSYEITGEEENNAYTTRSGPNQGFWHGGVVIGSVDENAAGEQHKAAMKGTVYYEDCPGITVFSLHPVYQTAEGKVYVSLQEGPNVSGEGEGLVPNASYTVSSTSESNGAMHTWETTLQVEIDRKHEAETIVLVQMDQENQTVRRDIYQPGQCPDQLAPQPQTAYLMVEYRWDDGAGEEQVERELVQQGEPYLYTPWKMDSGFFASQPTEILWRG